MTTRSPEPGSSRTAPAGTLPQATTFLVASMFVLSALVGAVGFFAPTAEAHPSSPAHAGSDHGEADDGLFNVVEGFSTKTGFRLVFAWDTDEPIAGHVEWGFQEGTLDRQANPFGDAVDTAGVAIVDVDESEVEPGKTVYFQVRDEESGQTSEVHSFEMDNAWVKDSSDDVHEISFIVQLDSQALPAGVPTDQGLQELASAMDVVAERIWDATDEHVRVDDVIVTDTVLNYPQNAVPKTGVDFNGNPDCTETSVEGYQLDHSMADVLIQSSVPFDSHTFSERIGKPCTGIYLGRLGQLVVPWGDGSFGGGNGSVHLAQVLSHEIGHYAFGLPDLYPAVSDADCLAGTTGEPGADTDGDGEPDNWDVSLMHNGFGYDGNRWIGSEIDRGPDYTPCGYNGEPASWPILANLYPGVPTLQELEEDPDASPYPNHDDSDHTVAEGNPDGGELDVYWLDQEPGTSQLKHAIGTVEETAPDGPTEPEVNITDPADGDEVAPDAIDVEGTVDREAPAEGNQAPSASISADETSGEAPHTVEFTLEGTDADGQVASWSLDPGFDQGTYGGDSLPATREHTYEANGTYEAVLTVEDDEGATTTATVDVHVGPTGDLTRIGTDVTGDTNTGDCSGAGATNCDYAWIDPVRDALDLEAAWIEERNEDQIRFTWQVADASDFTNTPTGPDSGSDEVVSHKVTTSFSTSPGTEYRVSVIQNKSSDEPAIEFSRQVGVLVQSFTIGREPVVDEASDRLEATIDKGQIPELAVLSSVDNLAVESAFIQNGTGAGLIVPVDDDLSNKEASSYGFHVQAPTSALSVGQASAQPAPGPDEVPGDADVEITDPAGDVTAAGLPVDHMDLRKGWFDNDRDFVYVGLQVEDIPQDANTTAQVAYHVNFLPPNEDAWDAVTPEDFVGLRVEAVVSAVAFDLGGDLVQPYDGAVSFELQTLTTDGTQSFFDTVTTLPASQVRADSDVIWWAIPQSAFQDDPTNGDALAPIPGDDGADAVPAVQGLVTFGTAFGDGASWDGDPYSIQEGEPVLRVDAGGPYSGAPGETIDLAAEPSGGNGEYECTWTSESDPVFGDASSCETTALFDAAGTYEVTVTVEDTDGDGDSASDTATVTVQTPERVELFVDDETSPRATVEVDTGESQPSGSWAAEVDLSDLLGDPGLHDLTAQWIDSDGTLLDAQTVSVDVRSADVDIFTPEAGADVVPPTPLEGNFSTVGPAPNGEDGSSAQEAMAPPIQDWATDPFVQATLDAPAYEDLVDVLSREDGFVAAVPRPGDDVVVAYFDGPAPEDAPDQMSESVEVRYVEDRQPDTLTTEVREPADPIPIAEWEAMSPEERLQELSHSGPKAPGIQQGAGPGTAIQMRTEDENGDLSTFICTASYLVKDPDPDGVDRYYLATAGHCLLDATASSSYENPASRARWVNVCVADCVSNYASAGSFVQLNPDGPYDGYHPVEFAVQGGIGADFGLVEIPKSLNEHLRPHLPVWSGPTGYDDPLTGDGLVHYGHGVPSGLTPPTQARAGLSVASPNEGEVQGVGYVAGGDSGSAVGTAAPRTSELVVGDGASGALTHSVVVVGAPVFFGTDLQYGLDELAAPHIDFDPQLVTEHETIEVPDEVETPVGITIERPLQDEGLDPSENPTVDVEGSSQLPDAALPGSEDTRTQYFLHRTDCGGNDQLFMNRTNAGVDGGDGCGNLAQPVGPVWEAVVGPISNVFPAQPTPSEALYLDPTREVEATLYFSGYQGSTSNPQPVPSVVNDIEVRLTVDGELVGSERKTNEFVLGTATPVDFSFAPQTVRVPAGADLTFTFIVHQADGPVFTHYGGENASNLRLPDGESPFDVEAMAVEDAVPDPTAQYHLDEDAGATTFADAAGDHDATCEAPACPTAGDAGAFGQAATFDGDDDVLTADGLAGFEAGTSFAVEAWFRIDGPSSTNPDPRLVAQGNSQTDDGAWSLWVQDDGSQVGFRAVNDTGDHHDATASSLSLDDGAFHQAVATYDGTAIRLYVDGQQVASTSFSDPIPATDDPVTVGNSQGERPFHGAIDEVALYEAAIDPVVVDGTAPTSPAPAALGVDADGDHATWSAPWDIAGSRPVQHAIHATLLQEGTVLDTTTTSVSVTDSGPSADFDVDVDDTTVDFLDRSTAGTAAIESWDWDLGDGTTSTEQDPTHTYALSDEYEVTLTVTDEEGRTDTTADTVAVGILPVEVRLTGPSGTSIPWTTVAEPQLGQAGGWDLTWDPSAAPEGDYTLESRMLQNGSTVATDDRGFQVPDVAPTLTVPEDRTVLQTRPVEATVLADDVNGETPSLAAADLPEGATFDDHGDGTATFAWTPDLSQDGTYTIEVAATDADDATLADEGSFSITVEEAQVVNDDAGVGYASIQAAIDSADAGDTLLVSPGTYEEAPTVPAGLPGLTLCQAASGFAGCAQGPDPGEVVVDGSHAATVLDVGSQDVAVRGLTVLWDGTSDVNVRGVDAAPGLTLRNATVRVAGTMTQDSTAEGQIFGVDASAHDGVLLADARLEADLVDQDQARFDIANGIYAAGDDVTITSSNLVGWASNAAFLAGDDATVTSTAFQRSATGVLACGTGDVNVSANVFEEHLDAIRLCGSPADADGDGTVARVAGNGLGLTNEAGLAIEASVTEARVEATCNDWGAYDEDAIRTTRVDDQGTDNTVVLDPYVSPTEAGLECLALPQAAFNAPDEVTRLEDAGFNDESKAGDRPILTRSWDFGDDARTVSVVRQELVNVTHRYDTVGEFPVTLTVEDAEGFVDVAERTVTVENLAPTLDPVPEVTVQHDHGTTESITVTASDPESDPMELSTNASDWIDVTKVEAGTWNVTLDPQAEHIGVQDVAFTVADDPPTRDPDADLSRSDTSAVPVQVVNAAPEWTQLPTPDAIEAGETLTVDVAAEDPDGDAVALDHGPLPDTVTVETHGDGTATVTFEPTSNDENHAIDLTATDGHGATTAEVLQLRSGAFPVIDAPTEAVAIAGEVATVTVSVDDPDTPDDLVNLSAEDDPPGASFTDHPDDTGTWTWDVPNRRRAPASVTFVADDGDFSTSLTTQVEVLKRPVPSALPAEVTDGAVLDSRVLPGEDVRLRSEAIDLDGSVVGARFDLETGHAVEASLQPDGTAESTPVRVSRLAEAPSVLLPLDATAGGGVDLANVANASLAADCATDCPTSTSGALGAAASFDGTDDVVRVGPNPALEVEPDDAYTLSTWVKPDATGSAIVSKMDPDQDHRGFDLYLRNDGTLRAHLIHAWSSHDAIVVDAAPSVDDGEWHQVAVTYDGSGTAAGMTLYVDGQAVDTTVAHDGLTGSTLTNASFEVGARDGEQLYQGDLDEVFFADRVLPAEVLAERFERSEVPTARAYPGTGDLPAHAVAIDDHGLEGTTSFTLEVGENQAPNASAPEQVVVQGLEQVELDASESVDPEGRPVSVTWTLPDGSQVENAEAVWQPSSLGIYQASVSVTDNLGLTTTETVEVVVDDELHATPALSPGADDDPTSVRVDERPVATSMVQSTFGAPVDGAEVRFDVVYDATGQVLGSVNATTDDEGVAFARLPYDVEDQLTGDGANLVGDHTLRVTASFQDQVLGPDSEEGLETVVSTFDYTVE